MATIVTDGMLCVCVDGPGSDATSANEGGPGVGGEVRRFFLCVATILGGAATESRRR